MLGLKWSDRAMPNDVPLVANPECVAGGASQGTHVGHGAVLPIKCMGVTGTRLAVTHDQTAGIDVAGSTGIPTQRPDTTAGSGSVNTEVGSSTLFAGLRRVFTK